METDKNGLAGLTLEEIQEIHNRPTEPQSAFAEENFAQVLLIQVSRLYDVGMALLAIVDKDKAVAMAETHAQGILISPAPAFQEEEDE
jgi:hypothetical protein